MKAKLWWQLGGVVLLTAILLANVVPWRQWRGTRDAQGQWQWPIQAEDFLDTLRPGIDLAGGTRLIYQVDTKDWAGGSMESPAQVMISALKDRVDPTGSKNIIWRPVGNDRIEVVIPRATATSTKTYDAYQAQREALLAANIRPLDIDRARDKAAKAQSPEARREAFTELVRGIESRRPLLAKLADAYAALIEAEKAAGPSTRADLDARLIDARASYDDALANVMQTNVRWLDVYQVLKVGRKARGTPKKQAPSPLDQLLATYPQEKEAIQKVVASYDQWQEEKESLDDPNDLKRLIQGTGILEFRIAVQPGEVDAAAYLAELKNSVQVSDRRFRWMPVDERLTENSPSVVMGNRLGTSYVLVWDTPDKRMIHDPDAKVDWRFASAHRTRGEWGPIVAFEFDQTGGDLFSVLTGNNKQKPLAAILDGTAISIATIRSQIGKSGIIEGSFNDQEAEELAKKMMAGALPGRLSKDTISESQIGAQLGESARKAGFYAAVVAIIAVAVFMLAYYLVPLGLTATIAVLLDIIIILGFMAKGSLFGTGFTFTLPGIAGLALTIGMAVDANVLINERIREEQDRGLPLRAAVKNGYGRALSAILDSNITTLITTVILYLVGTAEVRGFAIVLGIGIVASMFTAVIVTRILLQLGIEYGWFKNHFKMVRLIGVPKVRWIRSRYIFWGASAICIVAGAWAFFGTPSRDLYDVEFIGGTKVQFTLAPGKTADENQIEALVRSSSATKDGSAIPVAEGSQGGRLVFEVSTTNDKSNEVRDAIVEKLERPNNIAGLGTQSLVESRQALGFDQMQQWSQLSSRGIIGELPAGVIPITDQFLQTQESGRNLADFVGGVAIKITGINPPATLDDLRARIRARLSSPQYQSLPSTGWDVIGVNSAGEKDGQLRYAGVLFLAHSDQYSYDTSASADNNSWRSDFALKEVQMLTDSLMQSQVLDSISNFQPSVAQDVKYQALLAVLLSLIGVVVYVWIRFGNIYYGLGSIVPLFHDVCVVIGLVALSRLIAGTSVGHALMIHAFRFDLTLVAAILTIIGYSINDTIVVFDRIRENRGRLDYVTPTIIDGAINQTMSRTILTGLTTFVAILIMYVLGGSGIHGFSYAMSIGLFVGTYSSIAIAAPFLLLKGLSARRSGGRQAPSGSEK